MSPTHIGEILRNYQTLIVGVLASGAWVATVHTAKLTAKGHLLVAEAQRRQQIEAEARENDAERRAAAVLIWAEVRVIQMGCSEWIAKYMRRAERETAGNAQPGSAIQVPRSTKIYESNMLRLALFSPKLVEQIVYFYLCMPVYSAFLDRPVTPSQANQTERETEILDAQELERRARKLADLMYSELFPGEKSPPNLVPYQHEVVAPDC